MIILVPLYTFAGIIYCIHVVDDSVSVKPSGISTWNWT